MDLSSQPSIIPAKSQSLNDLYGKFLYQNHFPLWLALNHHRTHTNKQMTMKGHLYLVPILTDTSRYRVVMKSTQGGFSECLIIITWSAAKKGAVVFYVLPTHQLMERFVSNRYEKSMSLTSYYRQQRASGRSKEFNRETIDNKALKDIGLGVINFAGSGSEVPFVEIPADWFVVDEADKCNYKHLEMGKERLGHSRDPHEIYAGNPTFVGSFLDNKFKESTMGFWNIKCGCGHHVQMDFFKHVVERVDEYDYVIRDKRFDFESGLDINPICDKCYKPFDRFGQGQYIDTNPGRQATGKQFSRMFSGNSTLVGMVKKFSEAQENDYKMQRFYNSELGLSYTAEGSKITLELVKACMKDYLMPSSSNGPCVMGIDVGNKLHVRINKILPDKKKQAVYIGTVGELSELLALVKVYNVVAAVIDAMPEIRLARTFSHSAIGHFRCFFGSDKTDSINIKEKTVTCSRTARMDDLKESIVKKDIVFPKNVLAMEEYMDQIQAPTRIWDEDRKEYLWVEGSKADHFHLAETYCNLAETLLKFITG